MARIQSLYAGQNSEGRSHKEEFVDDNYDNYTAFVNKTGWGSAGVGIGAKEGASGLYGNKHLMAESVHISLSSPQLGIHLTLENGKIWLKPVELLNSYCNVGNSVFNVTAITGTLKTSCKKILEKNLHEAKNSFLMFRVCDDTLRKTCGLLLSHSDPEVYHPELDNPKNYKNVLSCQSSKKKHSPSFNVILHLWCLRMDPRSAEQGLPGGCFGNGWRVLERYRSHWDIGMTVIPHRGCKMIQSGSQSRKGK